MAEETEEAVETEEEAVAAKYHLHIEVPAEMKPILMETAELAYRMGQIPKPDLVDLISLFIGWGRTILKEKGLSYIGYR